MVAYDDNGNRDTMTYYRDGTFEGDTTAIDYTYNKDNRLTAFSTTGDVTFSLPDTTIDGLGRLIAATETLTDPNGGTITHSLGYTYDMRSQLLSGSMTNIGGSTWSAAYTYDKAGNIYSEVVNSTPTAFAYDGDLMTAKGSDSLDWDLNGRMTSGITGSMEWNWDGKLQSASAGANSIALKYAPGFDRVYKESTVDQTTTKSKYIVDPTGDLPVILLEIDPDENDPNACIRKTYIYANSQLVAQHDGFYGDDIYFYLHDRLGSVRQVVDYSGSVLNSYTYDAWGNSYAAETVETIPNPFRFAGYYWDEEISQYFCNARQYEPAVYRFTTRDPVCGLYDDPITLHRYLYGANDPVGKVDPSGRFWYTPGDSTSDIMDKAQSHVPSVVKDTLWLYNARNMDITTAMRSGGDLWQMVEGLNQVQQNVSTLVQKWQLFRRASNAERCVVEARRDFVSELGKCGTEDFIISATGEIISTISEIITSAPGAGTGVGAATSAVGVLRTTACGIEAESNFGKRLRGCSGRQRSPD